MEPHSFVMVRWMLWTARLILWLSSLFTTSCFCDGWGDFFSGSAESILLFTSCALFQNVLMMTSKTHLVETNIEVSRFAYFQEADHDDH
ncbi:hypothetical protein M430DRAFT_264278 [Amorphotheca resinae ATCC 22711]|uniref:Uncharacterized protein n=1 Tax=Amorphotheca resinae ATCC 22711 TaxID=857342 RepID=A0A2T3AWK5_AMORE|nr:hypothetical protein M430DRAFT_264278 [Amorphotheca resinae ATCC 22711]PSS13056.1 hypothetical protein M430DRAFT_264278 [Amorphotheca resinae ATCC 22711]